MTKKVLLVSYSQTGQLERLLDNFSLPLRREPDIEIEHVRLRPQRPYPFPWKFIRFFNIFPETVHLQPEPIEAFSLKHERYDAVVLAYTVWFLSPSQPVTAFLQDRNAHRILKDTPVITLIGCRNMWLMAQETVKKMLAENGARLVGNIVKIDQSDAWSSFITTPAWMFTGKQKAVSWLPSAGISENEIADCQRFGERFRQALLGNVCLDKTLFRGMRAVSVNEKLMASEHIAKRSFYLWGKLLMASGRISDKLRLALLYFYIVFLVVMVLTVVPLSALVKQILHPLLKHQLAEKRHYFSEPSGEE